MQSAPSHVSQQSIPGTSPLRPARHPHPSSEEHVEYVHRGPESSSASRAAFFHGPLPAPVIQCPLLGVGQHLVGLRDLLELGKGRGLETPRVPAGGRRKGVAALSTYPLSFAGVLVGMVFQRQPPVRSLDLVQGGARLDAQEVIVACFFHHLSPLMRWWRRRKRVQSGPPANPMPQCLLCT